MSIDLYFDSVTGQRVTSPTFTQPAQDLPSAKLMSTQLLRIQYLYIPGGIGSGNVGTPVAAPSNLLQFGLKAGTIAQGRYSDATFDAFTDQFTAPAVPTLSGAFYTAYLTVDGDAIRALFPVASDGTSAGTAALIAEVRSGQVPSSTFPFQVLNNVIKLTESPAVAQPGPSGYPTPAAVSTAVAQAAASYTATATLYVDAANGSDTEGARGTSAAFASLASAFMAAQPGDRIVARGVFTAPGVATLAAAGVTLDAYAAKIVCQNTPAAPLADVTKLLITGANVKVLGLEIDGNLLNAPVLAPNTLPNIGAIAVSGKNVSVQSCYVHDSAGYGVEFGTGYDGSAANDNWIENCQSGVKAYAYGTADIDGLTVKGNWFLNCPYGGYRGTNNSSGANSILREDISGNVVLNTTGSEFLSLGIELWGGGVVGKAKAPHRYARVCDNFVSGYQFGISLNGCVATKESGNRVVAGSYCGIELVSSHGIAASDDWIDGSAGSEQGYIVDGGNGTPDAGADMDIHIQGGKVFGNFSQAPVHFYNLVNASARGVTAVNTAGGAAVWAQLVNRFSAERCTLDNSAAANAGPVLAFELAPGVNATGLRACDNTLVSTSAPTAAIQVGCFGGAATATGMVVTGNTSTATFCGSGYLYAPGVTLAGLVCDDNVPQAGITTAASNGNQSGFPNAASGTVVAGLAGSATQNGFLAGLSGSIGTYFFGGLAPGVGPIGGVDFLNGGIRLPVFSFQLGGPGPNVTLTGSFAVTGLAAGGLLKALPGGTLALATAADLPGGGIAYSEQTWDCTANVTVSPATTVLRLTTGTPSAAGHIITLPPSPANGQALEIVVPPSTGTVPTDPATGGPVHFLLSPAALAIFADTAYTRVYRLIAGTGGWAVDTSAARQGTAVAFASLALSGSATLLPQASAPAAPAGGVTLYVDGNDDLHALHADGTDHTLSAH